MEDVEDDETDLFLTMKNVPVKKKTIKSSSLFTGHFNELYKKAVEDSNDEEVENSLKNIEFLEFLLDFFMPYAGIWASFVFQEIQSDKSEEFTRITKNLNSYVLTVLSDKVKHWTLMFLSLKSNEVTYLNSFQASRDDVETFRLNWMKFCKTRIGLKEKQWSTSIASYGHIKQVDGFSCGVFVCHFFELLLNGQLQYLKNFYDVAEYRIKIRNTLTS